MRIVTVLTAALLTGCQTLVQEWFLPNDGVRPREYRVFKYEEQLLTADGIPLVADVYRPLTDAPTPTILVRIPLSDNLPNRWRAGAVARYWATRGYNVVIQGSRGRYKSGGDYYPLRHERADGIETLRWLNEQSWFDGRLGMWGGSTFGYTQWAIADQRRPRIGAHHIHIASTSFYDMFYPGGAFSLQSALRWALQSSGKKDIEPTPERLRAGFEGFPLIRADDRAGRNIVFFDDWAMNTKRNGYWRSIDGEHRAAMAGAPVQMLAGWFDPFLPTQLRDFTTLRSRDADHPASGSEIIIGPWSHAREIRLPGGTALPDYRRTSIREGLLWFDRHLLGLVKMDRPGAVKLFVMGANTWRYENEWPLARTRYTELYFSTDGSSGALVWHPPNTSGEDRYVYDPRNPAPTRGGAMLGPGAGMARQNDIEARDDVRVYTSDTLESDLEITGPLTATLYVLTSAPNTDFIVRLADVHESGDSYNVSEGILRTGFAARGKDCRGAQEISIELWPTSYVFKRGHRLRVHVTSSSFPRFDRNPNTANSIPHETQPVAAHQSVCYGPEFASHLTVPVIPARPATR